MTDQSGGFPVMLAETTELPERTYVTFAASEERL